MVVRAEAVAAASSLEADAVAEKIDEHNEHNERLALIVRQQQKEQQETTMLADTSEDKWQKLLGLLINYLLTKPTKDF